MQERMDKLSDKRGETKIWTICILEHRWHQINLDSELGTKLKYGT